MPPRPATQVVSVEFAARVRTIRRYVSKLESLHAAGHLTSANVTLAYEGAFLTYFTEFERQLERLFLGLVMNRYVVTGAAIRPLVEIRSESVLRNIVKGGSAHADYLPYGKLKARAGVFLASGKPFDRLGKDDNVALSHKQLLRNAVAHKSSQALKSFRNELVDGKNLPPAQRTPAGYLRGQHAGAQTRLAYYMATGGVILNKLCA